MNPRKRDRDDAPIHKQSRKTVKVDLNKLMHKSDQERDAFLRQLTQMEPVHFKSIENNDPKAYLINSNEEVTNLSLALKKINPPSVLSAMSIFSQIQTPLPPSPQMSPPPSSPIEEEIVEMEGSIDVDQYPFLRSILENAFEESNETRFEPSIDLTSIPRSPANRS